MLVQRTPLGDCTNCLSIKRIAEGTEVRRMTEGQWKRKTRMQGYNLDNLEVMMKEKVMDCNKKRKRNETEPD